MLGTNLWEISRIVAWGFAYWKLNYTNSKVEALNQPCRLTIVPQSWGIIHDGTDYGGDTWRFNGPSTLIASKKKKKKKEKIIFVRCVFISMKKVLLSLFARVAINESRNWFASLASYASLPGPGVLLFYLCVYSQR